MSGFPCVLQSAIANARAGWETTRFSEKNCADNVVVGDGGAFLTEGLRLCCGRDSIGKQQRTLWAS